MFEQSYHSSRVPAAPGGQVTAGSAYRRCKEIRHCRGQCTTITKIF
ncbi:hypothetical protein SFOMI_1589 [Sphingobium fuliginis]|uniref:Uncharacterized protein n=1 Tax=Sphingobium fuliginis (strain ATCC 27551) TaxID=336203 RepID=A0A292ZDS3_SPHSA|nr:hypothetical protein SFOMI_1589 [Sphingobium fuliginis]